MTKLSISGDTVTGFQYLSLKIPQRAEMLTDYYVCGALKNDVSMNILGFVVAQK